MDDAEIGSGLSPSKSQGLSVSAVGRNGHGAPVEITPRTKARKRLAGEMVAPTPGKAAPRKRGMTRHPSETAGETANNGRAAVSGPDSTSGAGGYKGKRAMMEEDTPMSDEDEVPVALSGSRIADLVEEEAEDEDEFGPSPMKGDPGRTFTSLIDEAISEDDDDADLGKRSSDGPSRLSGSANGQTKRNLNRANGPQTANEPGRQMFAPRPLSASTQNGSSARSAAPRRSNGSAEAVETRTAKDADGRRAKRTKSSRNGLPIYTGQGKAATTMMDKGTKLGDDTDMEQDDSPFLVDRTKTSELVADSDPAAQSIRDGAASGFNASAVPLEQKYLDDVDDVDDPISRLATTPPDAELEAASQSQTCNSQLNGSHHVSTPTRSKMLSLSDDEVDEFDPEADRHRRVRIVPTRRAVRRRGSDDFEIADDLVKSNAESNAQSDRREITDTGDAPYLREEGAAVQSEDVDMPHAMEGNQALPLSQSSASHSTPKVKNADIPPHLLSLLSLHSPRQRSRGRPAQALADLRARAIFDSEARRELRALERGQEVVMLGAGSKAVSRAGAAGAVGGVYAGAEGDGEEGVEGEEERLLALYGARSGLSLGVGVGVGAAGGGKGGHGDLEREDGGGDEGEEADEGEESGEWKGDVEDDDWESESEGWKRTGEDMEDW